MNIQMKSTVFNPLDPITILTFVQNFETTYDSNEIHEGAAMWLFYHFNKGTRKTALSHCVFATEENNAHRKGKLTTHCRVVSWWLETYATEDVIVKLEADIMNY